MIRALSATRTGLCLRFTFVKNGTIYLKGAVGNQLEKQGAETLARTEVQSFQVENELQVDNQTASPKEQEFSFS